jgi:hypothetical protein
VVLQENLEISRSYKALAAALAEASSSAENGPDLAFAHDRAVAKKPASGRLTFSPARAGH